MEFESRGYFFIILGAVILLISIVIFFVSTKAGDEIVSQEILEECKTLQYNGPGKVNMLFFAQKEAAEQYTEFFLNTYPLNENKEEFNFFYIDDYDPNCGLYKDIAILCHSKELIEKAASCPYDFIVVLEEEGEQIRSSAYLNVLSLNSEHVLTVFLHEFGHAFGNLAEEYRNDQNPPRGSQNCASECSDFEGETDGCFEECSQSNLHRSVFAGVMRTLSPEDKENPFGTFNANLIKDTIDLRAREASVLTGQATNEVPLCSNQRYILYYDKEISVNTGCAGTNGEGDSKYILRKNNGILMEESFSTTIWTEVQEESDEVITGDSYEDMSQPVSLTFPLIEADTLEIYDSEGNLEEELNLHGSGAIPCPI